MYFLSTMAFVGLIPEEIWTVTQPTGDCPNEYLPYLVENQVPIGV